MKVVIIGSGNVAEALAIAISDSAAKLVGVAARNAVRGSEVARIARCKYFAPQDAPEADLYIIAVSDRAVADAEKQTRIAHGAVVAHTAGAVAMDVLNATDRAVFYPFQTFTAGRRIAFDSVPLFIEGSTPKAERVVSELAAMLSQTVIAADDAVRRKVHLAGAVACNFANRMFGWGGEILNEAGLPFELLKPLIAETAAKALATNRPAVVQTGAAVRGDLATQECHSKMIADQNRQEIYKLISKDIWETSKKI